VPVLRVDLYVYISVSCQRAYLKNPNVQTSPNFRSRLPLVVARSSSGGAAILLRSTSGFVDDVIFVCSRPGKGDTNIAYTQSGSSEAAGGKVVLQSCLVWQ